jgi:hypothetical protein
VTTTPALYRPAELARLAADLPVLTRIADWVRDFLCAPDPELGRSGPVCPFAPHALAVERMVFTVVHTADRSAEEIDAVLEEFRQTFLAMEPTTGPGAMEKSILVILPDVSEEDAPALIDQTHHRLKADFVGSGLMLGKFHPRSEQGGLHNPGFRPLRSPVPLLAIRFMVDSDLPFLNRTDDAVADRIKYLSSYQQRFAETDTSRWAGAGRAALAEIQPGEQR